MVAVLKENAFKDKGKIEQIIGVLKKDWSIFKGPFTDYMQLLEIYNGFKRQPSSFELRIPSKRSP